MGLGAYPRLLAALIVFGWFAAGPAGAADPVFPPASRIGLAPPPGFLPSTSFRGFESPERKAAIIIQELPAIAYAGLEKVMTDESLKKQGITLQNHESVTLPSGPGLIMKGRQDEKSVAFVKWVLLASSPQLTGIVTVQFPESDAGAYPDETIRAALATTVVREKVPADEQLAVLPYEIGNLADFRIVRVSPGSAAALTEGPNDTIEFSEQPLMLITVGPGSASDADDRNNAARRAFAAIPGLKEVKFSRAGPMRLGGSPGHEIVADAKDARSDADLTVVQWLRFGAGGHMSMVAITRRDRWAKLYPRFRAVRDSISPR